MKAIESYNNLLEIIRIDEHIRDNAKESLESIKEEMKYYIGSSAPKGYSGGGSYIDADSIHGSKPELRYDMLEEMIAECRRLDHIIYLQEERLKKLYEEKVNILKMYDGLKGICHEVFYYRAIIGLTQQETAKRIDRTIRQVQNIERDIKISY